MCISDLPMTHRYIVTFKKKKQQTIFSCNLIYICCFREESVCGTEAKQGKYRLSSIGTHPSLCGKRSDAACIYKLLLFVCPSRPVPGSLSSLLHLRNRQRQPLPASMPGTLPDPTMPGSSAVLMPVSTTTAALMAALTHAEAK